MDQNLSSRLEVCVFQCLLTSALTQGIKVATLVLISERLRVRVFNYNHANLSFQLPHLPSSRTCLAPYLPSFRTWLYFHHAIIPSFTTQVSITATTYLSFSMYP